MNLKSVRPFIGAKNYDISRSFYRALGFEETVIEPNLSVFNQGEQAFYLQNAYVKDWVDNTMLFFEVQDLDGLWSDFQQRQLENNYSGVKLVPIRNLNWGREFFVHDPSGVLLHFGEFSEV